MFTNKYIREVSFVGYAGTGTYPNTLGEKLRSFSTDEEHDEIPVFVDIEGNLVQPDVVEFQYQPLLSALGLQRAWTFVDVAGRFLVLTEASQLTEGYGAAKHFLKEYQGQSASGVIKIWEKKRTAHHNAPFVIAPQLAPGALFFTTGIVNDNPNLPASKYKKAYRNYLSLIVMGNAASIGIGPIKPPPVEQSQAQRQVAQYTPSVGLVDGRLARVVAEQDGQFIDPDSQDVIEFTVASGGFLIDQKTGALLVNEHKKFFVFDDQTKTFRALPEIETSSSEGIHPLALIALALGGLYFFSKITK